MLNSKKLLGSFVLFLSFTLQTLYATQGEVVCSFDSVIQVHSDATLTVKESITVCSCAQAIKRGIVREFPTIYYDRMGNRVSVDFNVLSVTKDGKSVKYHIKDAVNGKRLFIGDACVMLSPGNYVYTITYQTSWQIGFFQNHDELYWNVTGNGWRLPIEKVSARVILPSGISSDMIRAEGYTGPFGARGKEYTVQVKPDGSILFQSTRPFAPFEGLTIVATWPKGFITQPATFDYALRLVHDNSLIIIFLLMLCAVLVYFLLVGLWLRRHHKQGTIIPLFHPPQDIVPGAAAYIQKVKYTPLVMTADIVNMAVHDFVHIIYSSSSKRYTLEQREKPTDQFKVYKKLYDILFSKKSSIKVGTSNREVLEQAREHLSDRYAAQYGHFKQYQFTLIFLGVLFSSIAFIHGFAALGDHGSVVGALGCAALVTLNVLGPSRWWLYSPEGKKMYEQLEGFKFYLSAAEVPRFEHIGTPPDKNPQLYEQYLPYAIALGVEKQWTAQFAPIFKQYTAQGSPYHPHWYAGGNGRHFDSRSFNPGKFSDSFSYSFKSAISSASTPPGSSSGSGGRGSSGGGGGGGGGGGW